jgi:hypothetical protein
MHRSILFISAVAVMALPLGAQNSETHDKSRDVRSSVGDLHVGPDADARKAGLPLYPGARLTREDNSDKLNFGILTGTGLPSSSSTVSDQGAGFRLWRPYLLPPQ